MAQTSIIGTNNKKKLNLKRSSLSKAILLATAAGITAGQSTTVLSQGQQLMLEEVTVTATKRAVGDLESPSGGRVSDAARLALAGRDSLYSAAARRRTSSSAAWSLTRWLMSLK